MDTLIVSVARSILCLSALASLTACGGGESTAPATGSSATPAAVTSPTSTARSTESTTPAPSPPASSPVNSTPSTPSSPAPAIPPANPVSSGTSANAAPQISGTPGTQVTVGQAYSFTPSASDPDGDHLTFSIVSKPSWASFNAATGQLSGTPTSQEVGSHEDITIRVSDGSHTTALAPFAISVEAPASTSVTLAWQAPTQNTDGSPLTNLAGYKIHYGSHSAQYTQTLSLNNPGLTRFVLDNLPSGTYYFAITAVATNGTESDLSGEATKIL